jgi:hypothetical protein
VISEIKALLFDDEPIVIKSGNDLDCIELSENLLRGHGCVVPDSDSLTNVSDDGWNTNGS